MSVSVEEQAAFVAEFPQIAWDLTSGGPSYSHHINQICRLPEFTGVIREYHHWTRGSGIGVWLGVIVIRNGVFMHSPDVMLRDMSDSNLDRPGLAFDEVVEFAEQVEFMPPYELCAPFKSSAVKVRVQRSGFEFWMPLYAEGERYGKEYPASAKSEYCYRRCMLYSRNYVKLSETAK